MTFGVVVRRDAQKDAVEIINWYRQKDVDLARDVKNAIAECYQRIAGNPELFQSVRGDIRKARLRRFPYKVYFRIQTKRVVIIAIVHDRRDFSAWWNR